MDRSIIFCLNIAWIKLSNSKIFIVHADIAAKQGHGDVSVLTPTDIALEARNSPVYSILFVSQVSKPSKIP